MKEQTVLYYRFQPVGIDLTSLGDVEKHSEKLVGFADIERRLQQLESAFRNKEKQRCDLTVTMVGKTVAELSVYHDIKFKLFSHNVKRQYFSLCIASVEDNAIYFYETDSFDFVQAAFVNLVENHTLPDTSTWDCVTF